MKEPQRWLDDATTSHRLREVLGAAPCAPALPSVLHAGLSSYASGLVTEGLLAKATAGHWLGKAALTKLATGSAVKALAVVSLMGTAGIASYVAVGHRLNVPSNSRSSVTHAAQRGPATGEVPPAATVTAISLVDPDTQVASVEHAPPPHAIRPIEPNGSATASEPLSTDQAPSDDAPQLSIADEARLLEAARSSLANDPLYAFSIVQHHQARYESGQLSAERELIAVDALLRLGRREEAQRRAAPRLEQAPDSLYAKRLRQLLGGE